MARQRGTPNRAYPWFTLDGHLFLPMTLQCPKCGETKLLTEFNRESARKTGLAFWCRECMLFARVQYGKENAEELGRYDNRRRKNKYRSDPQFRLRVSLRNRLGKFFRRTRKPAHTEELIGCSFAQAKAWLESKFEAGMTWENYGHVWHIDHKKPCAKFDLTNPAQQRECFHYTNLQPLFVAENCSKGAEYFDA